MLKDCSTEHQWWSVYVFINRLIVYTTLVRPSRKITCNPDRVPAWRPKRVVHSSRLGSIIRFVVVLKPIAGSVPGWLPTFIGQRLLIKFAVDARINTNIQNVNISLGQHHILNYSYLFSPVHIRKTRIFCIIYCGQWTLQIIANTQVKSRRSFRWEKDVMTPFKSQWDTKL